MVTTRRGTNTTSQAIAMETSHSPDTPRKGATSRGKKRTAKRTNKELEVTQNDNGGEERPKKKARLEDPEKMNHEGQQEAKEKEPHNTGLFNLPALERTLLSLISYPSGTIERGHIYFFYRPKVDDDGASSLDDVAHFQMLLIPRPPTSKSSAAPAEAVEAAKKHYRLISIGKKSLPDPSHGGSGHGRKDSFWATVTSVGDDMEALNKGLGEKIYETKTKGAYISFPSQQRS